MQIAAGTTSAPEAIGPGQAQNSGFSEATPAPNQGRLLARCLALRVTKFRREPPVLSALSGARVE